MDLQSPWLLTTYKSWDDPPSIGGVWFLRGMTLENPPIFKKEIHLHSNGGFSSLSFVRNSVGFSALVVSNRPPFFLGGSYEFHHPSRKI